MIYCGKCGANNRDNVQFCAKCGEKIEMSPKDSIVSPGPATEQQPKREPATPRIIHGPAAQADRERRMGGTAGFLILLTVLCFAGYLAYQSMLKPKPAASPDATTRTRPARLAILDLQTIDVEETWGRKVAELITTVLVESRRCEVVERGLLEKILQEQGLGMKVVDPSQAARIGALAGADRVLLGSIMKIGDTFTISLRTVDVQTAVLKDAKSAEDVQEKDIAKKVKEIVQAMRFPQVEIKSAGPNAHIDRLPSPPQTILVVMPEVVLQHRPPDPAAETEICRRLVQAGYTVIDKSVVAKFREGQEVRQALTGNFESLGALARDCGADIIVVGEAFAEQTTPVTQGVFTFRARAEARAVRTSDLSILVTHGVYASGADVTAETAAKQSLGTAGGDLAGYFIGSGNPQNPTPQ